MVGCKVNVMANMKYKRAVSSAWSGHVLMTITYNERLREREREFNVN